MTRKNTHTHTYTHPKKVSHSSVKELTGWQIRVRSFLPWRRILGKGPKLSIIISHPLLILSSIEYHLVFHDDQRPRRGEHQLGIKMFYTLIRYGSCGQLSSRGRTKAHSNDMRFSASSELSAGVSMANVNKLSQSSMASGQTIRSL